MSPVAALLVVAVLIPMVQGVASGMAGSRLCPDLGVLLAMGVGLHLRSGTAGLCVAAVTGYVTDLLAGALLGQHALARVMAFAAARVAGRRFNLRGAVALALSAAAITAANAVLLGALRAFFSAGVGEGLLAWQDLPPQLAVNAVFAPLVAGAVARLVTRLGGEDARRRLLSLEPTRWSP